MFHLSRSYISPNPIVRKVAEKPNQERISSYCRCAVISLARSISSSPFPSAYPSHLAIGWPISLLPFKKSVKSYIIQNNSVIANIAIHSRRRCHLFVSPSS
jgi:hypothetical protein